MESFRTNQSESSLFEKSDLAEDLFEEEFKDGEKKIYLENF